jgi:DNA-binding PadR family transcriptional regulator
MHKRDRIFMWGPGPGPGFGPPGPPGHFFTKALHGPGDFAFGRRRRMRRGDVRAAILLLLEEEPRNGYQVMQELEERSEGAWRPSPGSVYPALQLLADEGLIRGETREGGTVYELTDAGRAHVDEHRERFGTPWEQAEVPEGLRDLGRMLGEVAMAARQVMHTGNADHAKAAAEVLADTRRKLYGILAGD